MEWLKTHLGNVVSSYDKRWALSFFWRWLLFVHTPYLLVVGATNILKQDESSRSIALQVTFWVVFICMAILLNGFFIKKLSLHFLLKPPSVPLFKLGLNFFIVALIFQAVYIVPNYILNFSVSYIIGFCLAFTGNPAKTDIVSFSFGFLTCVNYVVSFYFFGAVSRAIALNHKTSQNAQSEKSVSSQ